MSAGNADNRVRTSHPSDRGQGVDAPPPANIVSLHAWRRHAWILACAAVVGAAFGAIMNAICLRAYPVWSGVATFEIRPDTRPSQGSVASVVNGAEDAALLAAAESRQILDEQVLVAAMADPKVDETSWGQKTPTLDKRVEELKEGLRVEHLPGTRLLSLSWRAHERDDVVTILNLVARNYAASRESSEDQVRARGVERMEGALARAESQIHALRAEIQDFDVRHGINVVDGQGAADRAALENLSRLRSDTARDLDSAQARLDAIDRKLRDGRFEDDDRRLAMQDPAVRQQQQQLLQIQAMLASSRERFGEEHSQAKDLLRRENAARDRMQVLLDETMRRNLQASQLDHGQRVASLKSLVERQARDISDAAGRVRESSAKADAMDSLRAELIMREQERSDIQDALSQLRVIRQPQGGHAVALVQEAVASREFAFLQARYMAPCGMVVAVLPAAGILMLVALVGRRKSA